MYCIKASELLMCMHTNHKVNINLLCIAVIVYSYFASTSCPQLKLLGHLVNMSEIWSSSDFMGNSRERSTFCLYFLFVLKWDLLHVGLSCMIYTVSTLCPTLRLDMWCNCIFLASYHETCSIWNCGKTCTF